MGYAKKWLFILCCLCYSLCFSIPSLPINDIQVRSVNQSTTDIKFIFGAKPDIHYFILNNPVRLVLDVPYGHLQIPIHANALSGTLIQGIRQGQQANQVLRLVFDFNDMITATETSVNDNTIVFELKNKSTTQLPVTTSAAANTNKLPAPTQSSPTKPLPVTTVTTNTTMPTTTPTVIKTVPQGIRKVVVVIDAGHGGKDPGAVGHDGDKEKDVVLAIAKDLYADINATAGMRAVMTRDGDYYLTLRQRLQKARDAKADIFIAIHADAYQNVQSHGASVYALSLQGASSEAARWLAEKENYSELGDVDLSDKNNVLRSVLIDLSQTATISSSLKLGAAVLGRLHQFTALHHNAVEQARFVVLKSPDIPSILVETGFLSNNTEELKLRNPQYQQQIAQAILQGAVAYFYQQPIAGTWIATQAPAKNSRPL